jgi:hypothetical protein
MVVIIDKLRESVAAKPYSTSGPGEIGQPALLTLAPLQTIFGRVLEPHPARVSARLREKTILEKFRLQRLQTDR